MRRCRRLDSKVAILLHRHHRVDPGGRRTVNLAEGVSASKLKGWIHRCFGWGCAPLNRVGERHPRPSFLPRLVIERGVQAGSDAANDAGTVLHADMGFRGMIILIRTFLSFTLEVELSGPWPWREGASGDS